MWAASPSRLHVDTSWHPAGRPPEASVRTAHFLPARPAGLGFPRGEMKVRASPGLLPRKAPAESHCHQKACQAPLAQEGKGISLSREPDRHHLPVACPNPAPVLALTSLSSLPPGRRYPPCTWKRATPPRPLPTEPHDQGALKHASLHHAFLGLSWGEGSVHWILHVPWEGSSGAPQARPEPPPQGTRSSGVCSNRDSVLSVSQHGAPGDRGGAGLTLVVSPGPQLPRGAL